MPSPLPSIVHVIRSDMTTKQMCFPSSPRCRRWRRPTFKMSSKQRSKSHSWQSASAERSLSRYTKNCEKLLAKYAAAFRQIDSEFPRIEDFVRKYKVSASSRRAVAQSPFSSIVRQRCYVFAKADRSLFVTAMAIMANPSLKQFRYDSLLTNATRDLFILH